MLLSLSSLTYFFPSFYPIPSFSPSPYFHPLPPFLLLPSSLPSLPHTVAMYREPSLHEVVVVAELSPPRKTAKTSDSPVLQNGKKDPPSKTKTS